MQRLALATLAVFTAATAALACPFCAENRGTTLIGDLKKADMVVLGKFLGSKAGRIDESEFTIDEAIKDHAFLKGKKTISIPGYKPATTPFLVYIDLFQDEVDAYRGIEITPKSQLIPYLRGAMKLADAPPPQRLKYAFEYLQAPEFEIALDAYQEFAQADYKDYREMALSLPADTIAGWLKDPETSPYRYGLYASLLGHAGLKSPEKYGKVLKDMIDDPEKRKNSGIDGLVAGFVMLQPEKGLAFLREKLGDAKEEFQMRYVCLRTVRFVWEQRPDLLTEKQLVDALLLLAQHPDMADFAIGDLRRWNRWETTPTILKLFAQPSHQSTLLRRVILQFALHAAAQGNKEAKEFVVSQDTTWVDQISRNLQREENLTAPYRRPPDVPAPKK